jgi:hypothetical protein
VSTTVIVALVLLPVLMFLLALALATTRVWLGITALPRARHVVRAVRRRRRGDLGRGDAKRDGAGQDGAGPDGPSWPPTGHRSSG